MQMLTTRLRTACVALMLTPLLIACNSGDDNGTSTDPQSKIAPYLSLAALDESIVLNDGAEPLTDGNWSRYATDTTWNWQLNGVLDTTVEADVYVVDMFAELDAAFIDGLHQQNREVICYFSVGTMEPWRPDADLFDGIPLGNPHSEKFNNEFWVDITDQRIVKLMVNRMDMAAALGCDGVELDNVDAFVNDTGFVLTQQDALVFIRVLANEAHKRDLAVALKNNVELVPQAVEYFDLLINEECFQWNECEGYRAMIEAGKPVFNAEYQPLDDQARRSEICATANSYGFQTMFLPLELDGSFRMTCR